MTGIGSGAFAAATRQDASLSAAAPREDFLNALRKVPEPVTVVATDGPAGPGAVTVTAFSSVCADPPTIVICLQSQGSAASAVIDNGRFTVNFLSEADRTLAEICAGHGNNDHAARLADPGWNLGSDDLPFWGEALAHLTCQLIEAVEIGTHRVLVARVTAATVGPTEAALIYQSRSYYRMGRKIGDKF
ncbi:MAG: flavin reductase family protein [Kiloniellales bacterium]